jgi:hypothetical protein
VYPLNSITSRNASRKTCASPAPSSLRCTQYEVHYVCEGIALDQTW